MQPDIVVAASAEASALARFLIEDLGHPARLCVLTVRPDGFHAAKWTSFGALQILRKGLSMSDVGGSEGHGKADCRGVQCTLPCIQSCAFGWEIPVLR